jgi:hypothetical protein
VETPTPLSTHSVIEALCDSQLRPAALAQASSSDLVVTAVILSRQLRTSTAFNRDEAARVFAEIVIAANDLGVALSVMRPICDAELPWHVVHQLFKAAGVPYANGKFPTSEEVYAWVSTQPYGCELLSAAVAWELTRRMARWDLKRNLKSVALAANYIDDVSTLRTMLRCPGEGIANMALTKLADLLTKSELIEMLDEASLVNDFVWKDACRRLSAADVRRWAYKSDLSFIRRDCALGMIPNDELLSRVDDQSLESHVRGAIAATLKKRTKLALVSH